MHFWVYLLRCRDGRFYAGHTDNLEYRLAQHNAGIGSDFTRRRRPVELVWTDYVGSREEALAFERRIKGWTRAKKEALIAGDWAKISYLSRPPHERPSTALRTNDAEVPPTTVCPKRSAGQSKDVHAEQRPSSSFRANEDEVACDA